MKSIPENLLRKGLVGSLNFEKVLVFNDWCIAYLKCFDRTRPQLFEKLERHSLSDEVFILLQGKAVLIIGDGDSHPGELNYVNMEFKTSYLVPQNIWHHVVMSEEALIVLFERADTTRENSEYYHYDIAARKYVCEILTSLLN